MRTGLKTRESAVLRPVVDLFVCLEIKNILYGTYFGPEYLVLSGHGRDDDVSTWALRVKAGESCSWILEESGCSCALREKGLTLESISLYFDARVHCDCRFDCGVALVRSVSPVE